MGRGSDEEVPLPGGNMNAVVRVGDTVRRAAGPWTPTIHALLRHVRARGFALGPDALGIDEQGREILTYLPGTVPGGSPPDHVYTDATLDAVADAVRALHDATRDFVPPPGAVWQLPVHDPVEVVCHNDLAPYNMVWAPDGAIAGIIDWDVASPGPRVWDLAYAAYRFVPLVAPANPDLPFPGADEQRRRLARLCDRYAVPGVGPRAVLDTAIVRLRDLHAFMHRVAAAGNAAQQAIIDGGGGQIYLVDAAYLEARADDLAGPR